MDFEHSYWKYAELVNGRLAMVGVVILFLKMPQLTFILTLAVYVALNAGQYVYS